MVHKPGAQNIADYLSRQPVGKPEPEISDEAEENVAVMTDHSTPKAITRIDIVKETKDYRDMVALIKIINGEHASDRELRVQVTAKYGRVLIELCLTEDGIVIRGSCIVLPMSLQHRAVRTAHEVHQGRSKTKALLRTKVWFPNMDTKIESLIDQCPPSHINEDIHSAQPLQPTELPEKS